MAEVINLRSARKRTARDKAESLAAEQRLAHGVSKKSRAESKSKAKRLHDVLDQHRIETGDRR